MLLISVKLLSIKEQNSNSFWGGDKITYTLAPVFLSKLSSYCCGPLQATVDFLRPRVTTSSPTLSLCVGWSS